MSQKNINAIVRFLEDKPGYIKEGRGRLHDILTRRHYDVTLEECETALKQVRKESNIKESNEVIPDNFVLKSKWQSASGEWLESWAKKKDDEIIVNYLEEFRKNIITDLEDLKVPKYKPSNKEGKVAFEISLPDLHFGKGDVNDLQNNFFNSISSLLAKYNKSNIDYFILPIGNDGMNSEGMRSTTTSGTPQTDSIKWYESFSIYCNALIKAICMLKSIAPVKVIVVQGNHDWERMFYAGEVISAYFSSDEYVDVNNATEPRKYHKYGNCMLMYTHGDKEKATDLPLIMATEQPIMFAETKHREAHCGHLHKEMVNEYRGIKVRFLPSICTTDDWHKQMGYEAYRCAQAYIWNKETGLEGFLQHNL
jgi:hypothetical protein